MNNISKYSKSDNCCGCAACVNVCPKGIIKMEADEKGFQHPVIEEAECVECGLCEKVCAFNAKKEQLDEKRKIEAYAVKNRNLEVRMNSRSGGVFTALTDKYIEDGGVVYGVALDENYLAYHCRAVNKQERDCFRGSKYIQSNIGTVYKQVKKDLQAGKKVLFSGTPCQVNALKKVLFHVDCSNLLLVDIICHGVPSPKVWRDYLNDYEKRYGGRITQVDFRNKKKYGWAASMESIYVDGTEYDNNLFIDLFNSGLIERASCFKCPYKSAERVGDITIGDFWGIDKVSETFNDNKGVSLILCNTEKGKRDFQAVGEVLEVLSVDMKECLQPALLKPEKKPLDRSLFWFLYNKIGGISFAKIYQYKIRLFRKLRI